MRKPGSHRFIEVFAEALPAMEARLRESARESMQASTWLVGLASGMVALLAANQGVVSALTRTERLVVLLLMLSCVTVGVLQRLLFWIAEQRHLNHFVGLQGYLIGYIAASNAQAPPILNPDWSVAQIVNHIKTYFDVDYSFLIEYQSPIEAARETYVGLYELEDKLDQEVLDKFEETAMAYAGRPKPQTQAPDSLDEIRREGRIISFLSRAATWCLGFTGVTFVAGLSALAIAIL